jgi:cytochrome c oxidase subunit 2
MTMRASRRSIVAGGVALLAAAVAGVRAQQPRVVKVVARKFVFRPEEIVLKRGEPVTIELTSADVVMGFNAPDFKVRADIIPGTVTSVTFTPDKAGTFTFLCDVFCGDGHEAMSGRLVVG